MISVSGDDKDSFQQSFYYRLYVTGQEHTLCDDIKKVIAQFWAYILMFNKDRTM